LTMQLGTNTHGKQQNTLATSHIRFVYGHRPACFKELHLKSVNTWFTCLFS